MAAVFTGRWTRGTIIAQALQRTGNVKIAQLARDRLNRILEEVYTQWEWPFLYKVFGFTFPSGNTGGQVNIYPSQALPPDFLKTEQETTGLRIINLDSFRVDFPVIEVDPVQFRRRAIPHDLEGQRPLLFYISYGEQFMYFWPAPTFSSCQAQLIYKFLVPDMPLGTIDNNQSVITQGQFKGPWTANTQYNPQDVVTFNGLNYIALNAVFSATSPDLDATNWLRGAPGTTVGYDIDCPLFPWGGWLSMAVEAWALDYDQDPRSQSKMQEVNAAFDNIRNIALPRASQEQNIPLDPTMFGPGYRDESSRYFRDWDWWGT